MGKANDNDNIMEKINDNDNSMLSEDELDVVNGGVFRPINWKSNVFTYLIDYLLGIIFCDTAV